MFRISFVEGMEKVWLSYEEVYLKHSKNINKCIKNTYKEISKKSYKFIMIFKYFFVTLRVDRRNDAYSL